MIRPAQPSDRPAIVEALHHFWGGVTVVGHGVAYDASTLPALISFHDELTLELTLSAPLADPCHDAMTHLAWGWCG